MTAGSEPGRASPGVAPHIGVDSVVPAGTVNGRVLVTGGAGYLGGRIVQGLRGAGLEVRVTSRRAAAGDDAVPLALPCDERAAEQAVRGCEALVHLAAMNEIQCAEDPEQALRVNGLGTLQLLRAALREGVRRFVYISTAHVYGLSLHGTVTEASLPRPLHPYAISHRVAEDCVLAAHHGAGIDGVVLRLSNGIGAPARIGVDRWSLVGNDLCRQAVEQRRLCLRSSGLQWRDFIPLSTVTEAVRHVLGAPRAALGDGLFNLGGGVPLRIIDVAHKIAARARVLLGTPVAVEAPAATHADDATPIDYRSDRLRASGFVHVGDIDAEIDATLRLCLDATRGAK